MKRSAFTLVELLVTIAVIALLVALLIPAVNMAREAARRTQCVNRQRNLAIALITYNNDNNGLPGYLNELGTLPVHSWAVALFPMISETKRYEVLMQGQSPPDALASFHALICPSDQPEGDARLSYVVNCGPVEDNTMDDIQYAAVRSLSLFKDHRFITDSSGKKKINTKVKIEEIPDGVSNTILLSENNDAGVDSVWYADWSLYPLNSLGKPTRNEDAVKNLGFIWSPSNRDYVPNSSIPGPRPSSKHPGTVVVAYADGTAKPINDDISMEEWLKAVCPNDAKLSEL